MALWPLFKRQSQADLKQWDGFMPRMYASVSSFLFGMSRTAYDYQADVGRGLSSSSVMPVIQWIMRAFTEAALMIQEQEGDEYTAVSPHPLTDLVNRPNAFYDGTVLWMATVYDYCWFGDSYWRILRNAGGQPGELWWIPPWTITAQWPTDGSVFISHYLYSPMDSGRQVRLELEEVIHFQHGIDPLDQRKGLPPLRSILREIWTDDEASNFTASLLRNSAVASTLITPDPAAGDHALIGVEQLEAIKKYITERFTGDHRGEPMAVQGPLKIQRLGFAPNELDLSAIRNTTEERVCAALGIPAAVVGFGTGLEQSKVGATMREMNEMAWQNGLVPIQRIMSRTLQHALLPLFEENADQLRVDWDYTHVQALQEDENAKAARYAQLVSSAIVMRSEARTAFGLESQPSDDVYHLPFSVTEIGPGAKPIVPTSATTTATTMNGNGNGHRPVAADDGGDDGAPKALKQGIDDLVAALARSRQPRRLRRPPKALASLATTLLRQSREQELLMMRELLPLLDDLGAQAAAVAEIILPTKQVVEDAALASRIANGMQWLALTRRMGRLYEDHFATVARSTFAAIGQAIGLETMIPDLIMRSIVVTGGRRAGLLDLENGTRQALFESLSEGRAAGEGVDALVARIRDQIPAGPWRDAQTRARVIARTETRYSQNLSSYVRAREVDHIEQALMFDARLGPTDEECEAIDGQIVSLDEARALMELEHPNGTRQMVGLPAAIVQDVMAEA